jgi:competence protein ComEA
MKKNILIFTAIILVVLSYYTIEFFSFDGEVELEAIIIPEEMMKIYITGEVINPGVYEIPSEARIEDVIEAAGGTTGEANLNTINLAMRLEDGDKVVIPTFSDVEFHDSKDLNMMTKEDLMNIDSVGEVTAQRIIDYRGQKGYIVLDDLIEVEGIGAQKLEVIRKYLEN